MDLSTLTAALPPAASLINELPPLTEAETALLCMPLTKDQRTQQAILLRKTMLSFLRNIKNPSRLSLSTADETPSISGTVYLLLRENTPRKNYFIVFFREGKLSEVQYHGNKPKSQGEMSSIVQIRIKLLAVSDTVVFHGPAPLILQLVDLIQNKGAPGMPTLLPYEEAMDYTTGTVKKGIVPFKISDEDLPSSSSSESDSN